MKKWIILFFAIISIVAIYNYVYQDHRNIQSEKAAYELSASEIVNSFLKNSEYAEKNYLNKTILIRGTITEMDKSNMTLNDSVWCVFDKQISDNIKINAQIEIKGRVIGYDDLLEQVKMDQCYIVN